jgi:hypothetical protein
VEGQYVLRGDNRIPFQLGGYDRRRPIIIDPVLAYSIYLGKFNPGADIAIDSSGKPMSPAGPLACRRKICAEFD